MRRYAGLLCGLVVMAAGILGYSTSSNASPSPVVTVASSAAVASNQAEVVEDSMHEFMEYVFQPTYRRLKVTMETEPGDNKGWKAMKSDSLILAESCNLLFGRAPEEGAEDWNRHAAESRSSGAALYKAAREKNFEQATASYKLMLNNCNACHKQFEDGRHILEP